MAKLRSLLLAASVGWSVKALAEPQDSYASQTSIDTCSDGPTQTVSIAAQETPSAFPAAITFNTSLPSSYLDSIDTESTSTNTSPPASIAVTKTQESSLNAPVVGTATADSAHTKTQESSLNAPEVTTAPVYSANTKAQEASLNGPAVTDGYVPMPSDGESTVEPTQGADVTSTHDRPKSVSFATKTTETALDTPAVTNSTTSQQPNGGTSSAVFHSPVSPTPSTAPAIAVTKTTQTGLVETTYASAVTKTTVTDTNVSESPGLKTPGVSLGGPPNGYLPLPPSVTTTEHASPAASVVTVVPTAGSYITAGASAVTVGGTTYSLAPSADSIYVNGAASTVARGNVLTWTSAASAYVTGGTTITAGAPGVVVSGTTYSLAGSAPALYVNGVASTVAPAGLWALAAPGGAQTTAIPWTALAGSVQSTGPATLTTAIVTPVPLQTTSPQTSSPASPSLANDASDIGSGTPFGGMLAAALLAAAAYI